MAGQNCSRARVVQQIVFILSVLAMAGAAAGQEPVNGCLDDAAMGWLSQGRDGMQRASATRPNWQVSTFGGLQFWTDIRIGGGWRIQQHCMTGHCRLLDPSKVRRAWGAVEAVTARWHELAEAGTIPQDQATVVVLVHGLARTAGCWLPMGEWVQRETGWQVIDFHYASTRRSVADHAAALRQVLDGLGPEVRTIHFVTHSLGGIVVRRYFGDLHREGLPADPRLGRLVMIGPPNQGSRIARLLQPTGIFGLLTGRSGTALGRGWESLARTLAVPDCEFAIIAGGDPGGKQGWNPVLSGPSDGTVAVSETRLPGARDFLVMPLFHATMMKQPEVCAAAVRFLQTGCLSESGACNPLEPEAVRH